MVEFRGISAYRTIDNDGKWQMAIQVEFGAREIASLLMPLDDAFAPLDVRDFASLLSSMAEELSNSALIARGNVDRGSDEDWDKQ